MARRARKKESSEHFSFEVTTWWYEYGLHINPSPGMRKYLGLCWETNAISLRGPLRSPTRRRIEVVQFRLDPRGRDPLSWKEEWKGLGAVTSIRKGTIGAFVSVPTPSFQAILVAIGLNKIRFVTFSVDFVDDRRLINDLSLSEFPDEEDPGD